MSAQDTASLDAEISELKVQRKELRKLNAYQEAEVSRLNRDVNEARSDVERLTEQVNELKEMEEVRTGRLASAVQRISALEDLLCQREGDLETMSALAEEPGKIRMPSWPFIDLLSVIVFFEVSKFDPTDVSRTSFFEDAYATVFRGPGRFTGVYLFLGCVTTHEPSPTPSPSATRSSVLRCVTLLMLDTRLYEWLQPLQGRLPSAGPSEVLDASEPTHKPKHLALFPPPHTDNAIDVTMNPDTISLSHLPQSSTVVVYPSDPIPALQHQIAQQGSVILDLQQRNRRWVNEGRDWNRTKEDMRRLIDIQSAECLRLREDAARASQRADRAEDGFLKEVQIARNARERESELTNALQEALAVVELERTRLALANAQEERQRLQSTVDNLQGQMVQSNESHRNAIADMSDRLREVEDERTALYGELQVAKSQMSDLQRNTKSQREEFAKRRDEAKSEIDNLKRELVDERRELERCKTQNQAVQDKMLNVKKALNGKVKPALSPPLASVRTTKSTAQSSKDTSGDGSSAKRKVTAAQPNPEFFQSPSQSKKRRLTVS
ncbi:hypothetical protein NMY22_g13582 [Coprinellus aureogranulatus]|nr:hypothetical protein NMY22_g13582 [Coprinellus aureogranulatus]